MKKLRHHKRLYVISAILAIGFIVFMISSVKDRSKIELINTKVETGTVQQLVSVSGIAEAEQIAELGFSTAGIVSEVKVSTGDVVKTGDILAELDTKALYADRQDALSAVQKALADKDELINGPSDSAINLTDETILSKKETLATTIADEEQKVKNAYAKLLSSDLSAYSNDSSEDAISPIISGTYSCEDEGEYIIDVFSSAANSGYSFRLSGLETGTYEVSTSQPTALGTCGLRIIFDRASTYSRSNWIVEVPNTKASTYITNRNTYALAVTQSESAITQAMQAVKLAEADAADKNAPARSEAIIRADASISQANARLSRIDASISDRVLRAPFSGTITDINILPGETVATAPILTLLASNKFEVTAKIPEIDIGKLTIGQKVRMEFDARAGEILTGLISFISLKETLIDGVSYYEAIIQFEAVPTWMRSGLNADIDIVIEEVTDTLRIPSRFLNKSKDSYTVLLLNENDQTISTSSVKVEMFGNDGFVAISGLNNGDTIVAP